MNRHQKTCFVIMGFGKKTDLSTGKTLDLDKTYKNIIQPAVEKSGFQCIRADEIQDTGLIDKSMYALLMQADLVIADISTYNPNAIYELGIRHAVRPFSTIVIKEDNGKLPFDLDHTRILHYSHLGEDIGADEASRCQQVLGDMIKHATGNQLVDSPLYDFIKDITPPQLPEEEYRRIIGDLADREAHIFAIVERAKHFMADSNFEEATKLWEKASKAAPTEHFFVQQHALATYKSKQPSEQTALLDALTIISMLDQEGESNDPETLGLTGAIYKRLWLLNHDVESLKRASQHYEKGFLLSNDYYTGENYALCLDIQAGIETDEAERVYCRVAARKVREKILILLEDIADINTTRGHIDYKWAYATLANCHFALGNTASGNQFEAIFLELTDIEWERETFFTGKAQLQQHGEAAKSDG